VTAKTTTTAMAAKTAQHCCQQQQPKIMATAAKTMAMALPITSTLAMPAPTTKAIAVLTTMEMPSKTTMALPATKTPLPVPMAVTQTTKMVMPAMNNANNDGIQHCQQPWHLHCHDDSSTKKCDISKNNHGNLDGSKNKETVTMPKPTTMMEAVKSATAISAEMTTTAAAKQQSLGIKQ